MRYWWRQFQDTRDSRGLFDKESALFGSTKAASPFALRIKEEVLIPPAAPLHTAEQVWAKLSLLHLPWLHEMD